MLNEQLHCFAKHEGQEEEIEETNEIAYSFGRDYATVGLGQIQVDQLHSASSSECRMASALRMNVFSPNFISFLVLPNSSLYDSI